jgi:hypothetical protein
MGSLFRSLIRGFEAFLDITTIENNSCIQLEIHYYSALAEYEGHYFLQCIVQCTYMCVFMYVKSFSLFTWKTGNTSVYIGAPRSKEGKYYFLSL